MAQEEYSVEYIPPNSIGVHPNTDTDNHTLYNANSSHFNGDGGVHPPHNPIGSHPGLGISNNHDAANPHTHLQPPRMTPLPHSNSFHLIPLTPLYEDKTISQSASESEKLGKRWRSGSGSGSGSGNGSGSSVSHSSDSSSHHSSSSHSGIQENLEEAWGEFVHPAGVKPKHKRIVTWLGKVGFTTKGIVYGLIGGMTCASANRLNLTGTATDNESPQGVFIFIGGIPIGTPLLVIMFIGVLFYAVWRFWEAITGQGADAQFSAKKNFFRYRLSPFVSGCVYTAYLYYIIKLIPMASQSRSEVGSPGCFPSCWRDSGLGRAGLVLFGIAFSIATVTQLINTLTVGWHRDLRVRHSHPIIKYGIYTLGHAGFLARAGVFLFVAVLMFHALAVPVDSTHSTVANALNFLLPTTAGKVLMFILGIGLIFFGLFAILNSAYKYFPTPPPSREQDRSREGEEEEARKPGMWRKVTKWAGYTDQPKSPFEIEENEKVERERSDKVENGHKADGGYFNFRSRGDNEKRGG